MRKQKKATTTEPLCALFGVCRPTNPDTPIHRPVLKCRPEFSVSERHLNGAFQRVRRAVRPAIKLAVVHSGV